MMRTLEAFCVLLFSQFHRRLIGWWMPAMRRRDLCGFGTHSLESKGSNMILFASFSLKKDTSKLTFVMP